MRKVAERIGDGGAMVVSVVGVGGCSRRDELVVCSVIAVAGRGAVECLAEPIPYIIVDIGELQRSPPANCTVALGYIELSKFVWRQLRPVTSKNAGNLVSPSSPID